MSNQTDDFLRAREWAERAGRLEAERDALLAEVTEWRKLRDPANLHANLLRGLPAQLTREQAMHLCADDLQRMAELEAVARHEADCAEAFKAEAEALRQGPWIGKCQACGHEHEAPRPEVSTCTRVDLTDAQRKQLSTAMVVTKQAKAPAGKGNT